MFLSQVLGQTDSISDGEHIRQRTTVAPCSLSSASSVTESYCTPLHLGVLSVDCLQMGLWGVDEVMWVVKVGHMLSERENKKERDDEGERQRHGNTGVRIGKGGEMNSLVQEELISQRALPFHPISADTKPGTHTDPHTNTQKINSTQQRGQTTHTTAQTHNVCLLVDMVLQDELHQSSTLQIQQQQRRNVEDEIH